jgi:hypothetical protein
MSGFTDEGEKGNGRAVVTAAIMDAGSYCREVESHLCRKNDGHLIRIVGPAFELVCGWATLQIPLGVVHRAIDRTFDRYYAKEGRRRPVRIEYCEADVLELFDEWRRAVGVATSEQVESAPRTSRRTSLAGHIDRVTDRLTAWQTAGGGTEGRTDVVGELIAELVTLRDPARTSRGEARRRLVERLDEIQHQLTTALRQLVEPPVYAALRAEATRDLEPFRDRMPREALRRATEAGTDQLLYDHFKLPRISFE